MTSIYLVEPSVPHVKMKIERAVVSLVRKCDLFKGFFVTVWKITK